MRLRGAATGDAIGVRELVDGDEAAVLALLQRAFGRWPELETVTPSEFFRWKFNECPFGPAMLRVAEVDGAVAGVAAYMPWRFRDGQREVLALRGADLAVDAAHRGRGVSMAIRSAARFEEDFEFVWSSPNADSHPGAVKAGRRMATMPRFVSTSGPVALGARAASPRAGGRAAPGVAAAEILADADDVQSLLEASSAADGRLSTLKDLPYLRWRYGSFDRYRAVRIDSGGCAGIAIFRPRPDGMVVHVCELIVRSDDRRSAHRLLGTVRSLCAAPILTCRFPSALDAARAGFMPRRRRDVVDVHLLREQVRPDPCADASWALSLGDLELL
jgi:GNAT superfamily N-acetyltransferase